MQKSNGFWMILMVLLLLVGCGPTQPPVGTSTSDTDDEKPTTLTVAAYGFYSDDVGLDTINEFFRLKHPKCLVEIIYYPEPTDAQGWISGEYREFNDDQLIAPYRERFATEIMAGKGADVVVLAPGLTANPYVAAEQGYFEDLSPYIDGNPDFNKDEYFMPVLDAGIIGGKRYYLPVGFTYMPIRMTTETAKKYGLSPESQLTLQQWTDLAAKVQKDDGKSLFYSWAPTLKQYLRYIMTSGCPMPFDMEKKEANFDTPQFREALDFVKELALNQGNFMDMPFVEGEENTMIWGLGCALTTTEIATTKLLFTYPLDTVLMNFPVMEEGQGDLAFVRKMLAVNANSEKKELAVDFCLTALGHTVQYEFMAKPAGHNGGPSTMLAPRSVSRKAIEKILGDLVEGKLSETATKDAREVPGEWKFSQTLADQYLGCLGNIKRAILYNPDLEKMVDEQIQKYFDGEMSQDELVQLLTKRVDFYLKE